MNAQPTLDDVVRDPAMAMKLSPEARGALLIRAAAALAALSAVVGIAAPGETKDRALTVKEVASRMGLSEDYIYRHARDFPFYLPVNGARAVRFSERRLTEYLERRGEHHA